MMVFTKTHSIRMVFTKDPLFYDGLYKGPNVSGWVFTRDPMYQDGLYKDPLYHDGLYKDSPVSGWSLQGLPSFRMVFAMARTHYMYNNGIYKDPLGPTVSLPRS